MDRIAIAANLDDDDWSLPTESGRPSGDDWWICVVDMSCHVLVCCAVIGYCIHSKGGVWVCDEVQLLVDNYFLPDPSHDQICRAEIG